MASFQRIIMPEDGAPFAPYYAGDQPNVPRSAELEAVSSDVIAGLLNPPDMFPDVNRVSAELGAARGVPGSTSAFGVGLRLTDEERLRRIKLGMESLSGAYARHPAIGPEYFSMTPAQQAQLELEQERLRLARDEFEFKRNRLLNPDVTYSGGSGGLRPPPIDSHAAAYTTYPGSGASTPFSFFGGGGGGGGGGSYGVPLNNNMYPNPSDPLLPLYPGGPTPGGGTGGGGGLFDTDPASDYDYWNMGIGGGGYGGIPGAGSGAGSNPDAELLDFIAYGPG